MKPSATKHLLLLVVFNLIPGFILGPVWAAALCTLFLAYRTWIEVSGFPMPPRPVLWIMQVVVIASVWYNYRTFLGDQPASSILILLLGIKIFETRVKADFFFSGLLCLLVLMSYMLNTQSLAMTAFLIVDVTLVLSFLYSLEVEQESRLNWKSAVSQSLTLVLKASPILVMMFFLFPRFSTGLGATDTSTGKMGISDQMRPGMISQLMNSDELVFRATFLTSEMPLSRQLYWRGAILDISDGLNWNRSPSIGRRINDASVKSDIEVYLEPGFERFLFALDPSRGLKFPNAASAAGIGVREGGIYQMQQPIRQRERYFLERGEDGSEREPPSAVYLRMKYEPSPTMQAYLRGFRGKPPNQIVQEILDHLRTDGFRYSLQPPPSAGIDDFWFKSKIGFCEHFAASTASILRYLKIPSRVVVGFQGGTPSFLENFVSVRTKDAHAWVEYYDQAASRWRRLDPTEQVAPLRLSLGSEDYLNPSKSGWMQAYLRARAFVDEVDSQWTGFLLRYDLSQQKEFLQRVGMESVPYHALVVFLILGLILLAAIIYFFEARKREPLPWDEKLYRQLLKQVKLWGIERNPSDGPLTVQLQVQALGPEVHQKFLDVLEPLIQARYAGQELSKDMQTTLRYRVKGLRKLSINKPVR